MKQTIRNATGMLVAMTAASGAPAWAQPAAMPERLEAVTVTAARIAVGEVGSE